MKRTKREISQKDIKRFWNSVEKAGEDDCWGWKLCSNQEGYALSIKAPASTSAIQS